MLRPRVALLVLALVPLLGAGPPPAAPRALGLSYFGPPGPWERLGVRPPDLTPGVWAAYEVRLLDADTGAWAVAGRFEVRVVPDAVPRPGWRAVELGHAGPEGEPLRIKLLLAPAARGGWDIRGFAVAAPGQAPLPLALEEEAAPGGPAPLEGPGAARPPALRAQSVPLTTPAGTFDCAHVAVPMGEGDPLELWIAPGDRAAPFHVVRARRGPRETRLVRYGRGARAALPPLVLPERAAGHGTGRDQAKRNPSR